VTDDVICQALGLFLSPKVRTYCYKWIPENKILGTWYKELPLSRSIIQKVVNDVRSFQKMCVVSRLLGLWELTNI
jgi:hypothetical protein